MKDVIYSGIIVRSRCVEDGYSCPCLGLLNMRDVLFVEEGLKKKIGGDEKLVALKAGLGSGGMEGVVIQKEQLRRRPKDEKTRLSPSKEKQIVLRNELLF